MDLSEIMDLVDAAIVRACPHGLETEVIASALQSVFEEPDKPLYYHLEYGCCEWDV